MAIQPTLPIHQWTIWANLQELQNLPSMDSYLFYNYSWKVHPAFNHTQELVFAADDYGNAAGVYHELWKLKQAGHLAFLVRNWS